MKINISFLITALLLLSFQTTKSQNIYKDSGQPIAKRVNDLLSKMTLEEKVAQVMMSKNIMWDEKGDIKTEESKQIFNKGVGLLWFDKQLDAERMVEIYNASQKFLLEESRLGIPALVFGEGLHGFQAPGATVFPQAIAMASTWDTELIEQIYTATALEMRSRAANIAFTPVIGLARDPRWGRTDETFGEDPYLVAQIGVAAINGLQGRDATVIDNNHVAATAKHFVAHSVPQDGTNRSPAHVSKHSLYENFFYPFELAVKKAKVKSVMATYHEIDGTPIVGSKQLLTEILRNKWGFEGLITSDADAINHMHEIHRVTANKAESAKKAIEAGIDFDLAIFKEFYCFQTLQELVESGDVKEETLNRAVSKVLQLKFELGLFDNPYMSVKRVTEVTHNQQHKNLALKTAEKAIILLKNQDNILPLDAANIRNLAVIGRNAAELQYGSYSLNEKFGVSILDGLKNYAKGKFNVNYAEGCRITNEVGMWKTERNGTLTDPKKDKISIQEAVKVAETSDVAIVVVGGNEFTCREAWSNEHLGDRDDLNLLGSQNDLVQAVLKTGKPVIVILINGRPLTINEIDKTAPAILECWFLGEETGTAVAKTLFGEVNPGGKLPISFPRSVGQIPCYYNHKPTAHLLPYVFVDSTPLYPFGFGLSYTTFAYSNLKVTPEKITADKTIKISVDVKNTGKVTGDEVVQLYIRDDISSLTRPVKELKGFNRITLKAGETKTVEFKIGRDELQFYNSDMIRVVEPGKFIIMVGGNSEDVIKKEFYITSN
jgi:beta-glucosidase